MCLTNTLEEISFQKADKLHVRLLERFVSPTELLGRYHDFFCNAEALVKPCKVSTDIDNKTKEILAERKKEYCEALQKQHTKIAYDSDLKILTVHLRKGRITHSVDQGSFILDYGESGEIVGIELFNVVI